MRKYKTLFFDLDNTLWDFDKNSYLALKITFENFSICSQGVDFEKFSHSYFKNNERMWDEYRKKTVSKQELIRKRFLLTFAECGIEGIDPLLFNDAYLTEMPKQSILIDGAVENLKYLKSKNYSMHIITNGFKEVQNLKLTNSGLSDFFDKIIISEIIKAPKPAPEIFNYALQSTNSRKKESMMIGDSWEVDIIGAMNCGIDQVHYVKKDSDFFLEEELNTINNSKTSTFRINSLFDLMGIL